jgi:hypothetical protein
LTAGVKASADSTSISRAARFITIAFYFGRPWPFDLKRAPSMRSRQNAEERAILQRARGSRRTHPALPDMAYRSAEAVAASPAAPTPYPPAASARTLQLLGTIDALLRAPPQPPRWALLKALSVLEEHRTTGGVSSCSSLSRADSASPRSGELEAAAAERARRLQAG